MVFSALSVIFLFHDKVWLYAAAQEAATVGVMESVANISEGREAAQQRATELKKEFWDSSMGILLQVKGNAKELMVQYQGKRKAFYGGWEWKFTVKADRKILRPVHIIRGLRQRGGMSDASDI